MFSATNFILDNNDINNGNKKISKLCFGSNEYSICDQEVRENIQNFKDTLNIMNNRIKQLSEKIEILEEKISKI